MDKDYLYIRAWGRYQGSDRGYIQGQIDLARGCSAPDNAIFLGTDGKWRTVDDVKSAVNRATVERIVEELS
jgi:hypothetical protein